MKITFLFLLHSSPIIPEQIIKRSANSDIQFYLHFDRKYNGDVSTLKNYNNVFITDNRHIVEWGEMSIVETVVDCCREICATTDSEFIVLLSGADYAVKNIDYIIEYIQSHADKDFIQGERIPSPSCHWLEGGRRRLECYSLNLGGKDIATIEPRVINWGNMRQFGKILKASPFSLPKAIKIWLTAPKRRHPGGIVPYKGEMWWGLRRSTIEAALRYIDNNPAFVDYHKNTCIPDEIFFNTLVYNLIPSSEISSNCLRFINWGTDMPGNSPFSIRNDEETLIRKIVADRDCLFARKVDDINTVNEINRIVDE